MKGKILEEEKVGQQEKKNLKLEGKVNSISQPGMEDDCSINYSEKFESIKEEKFSQKPSLKQ